MKHAMTKLSRHRVEDDDPVDATALTGLIELLKRLAIQAGFSALFESLAQGLNSTFLTSNITILSFYKRKP